MHLTIKRDWLTKELKTNNLQDMVAKSKVQVMSSGNVSITTIVGKHNVLVKDVLCIPQLTINLLSINQLIKNDKVVKFESNGCKIYNKQRQLIRIANLISNVYKLNVTESQKCFLAATGLSSQVRTSNSKDLTKMKNGVEGLICEDEIEVDRYNCIVQ